MELFHDLGKIKIPGNGGGLDLQDPVQVLLQILHGHNGPGSGIQKLHRIRVELMAVGGQADLPARPVQKPYSQLIFQVAHMGTDGRLG